MKDLVTEPSLRTGVNWPEGDRARMTSDARLPELDAWRPTRGRARVARRGGADVRVGAAAGGCRAAGGGRWPAGGVRQRRLCRGRRVRGGRACARDGPSAGHPLWHQRRAGVGRWPGLRGHDRRADRAGRARRGPRRGARPLGAGGRPVAPPRGCAGAEFGPVAPGRGPRRSPGGRDEEAASRARPAGGPEPSWSTARTSSTAADPGRWRSTGASYFVEAFPRGPGW